MHTKIRSSKFLVFALYALLLYAIEGECKAITTYSWYYTTTLEKKQVSLKVIEENTSATDSAFNKNIFKISVIKGFSSRNYIHVLVNNNELLPKITPSSMEAINKGYVKIYGALSPKIYRDRKEDDNIYRGGE